MARFGDARRRPGRSLATAAVVASAAVAVFALWLRIDTSALPAIGRYRDDAYYYFVWARSLAEGHGPTVSDGTATNGVQLAWGLLLAAVAAVCGASVLENAAQLGGLALHAAAAIALALSIPHVASRHGAALRVAVASAYLGHPFLLTEAQNGQETALAALALVLLCAARRARPTWFVVAALFATAARCELWLFALGLSLFRSEPWRSRLLWPLLPLAAWFLWNTALAGHPVPDAAAPMPWLVHASFERTDPGLAERLERLWWFGRPCLLGGPFSGASIVGSAVLAYAAVASWLRGVARRVVPAVAVALAFSAGAVDLEVPAVAATLCAVLPPPGRALRRLAWPLLGAATALCAAHFLLRQYPRPYYFVPLAVAGLLALAQAAVRIGPRTGAVLVLLVAAENGSRLFEPAPRRAWQETMVMAGRFLDRFVPPDAAVGCFNAGIVTWLRPGPVVNLDGVVHRAAFDALRAGRLGELLDGRGVRFVADNPVQFARGSGTPHACGAFFGVDFDPERDLRELARFVVPGVDAGRPGTDSFRVYARRSAAAPGPAAAAAADPRAEDLGPAPDGGRYVAWRAPVGARLVHARVDDPAPGRAVATAVGARVTQVLKLPRAEGVWALSVAGGTAPLLTYDARRE